MKLSKLIAKMQAVLDSDGDTDEVALCIVCGRTTKYRLDAFGEIQVLHDTAEYANGMTYLVAEQVNCECTSDLVTSNAALTSDMKMLQSATAGDDYMPNDGDNCATAGIHLLQHGNAIEIHAKTLAEARALRDEVLRAITKG